ncbi:MAG TPA: DUF2726 domain-containing protein [Pirellulales bacterium]|nr:DUF2726 domain-containing protein [Pirellulales bacterium]
MVARQVDMVHCEPNTTEVVAVIELDDRSHDRPERKRRDQFLNAALAAARILLLRFTAAAKYQPVAIRETILRALGAADGVGNSAIEHSVGNSSDEVAH